MLNGVDVGRDLHRITHRGGRYKPLLEHIARRKGRRQAVIRVRQRRWVAPPILTPQQIERICAACASWDTETRQWRGSVRNRLLWMLLAETGVRLGEALGLQHRDWHTGRGDTPFIEVVARDHPHGVRAKSGYRRLYVSDELDRLYGEYVCAKLAPIWPPTTSTLPASWSTSNGNRGSPRGDRTVSMTWWTGCAASCPGRCRKPGRRTGCGTATPPRFNAGVPLHVLQRYLGHLTPTMSMTYAQTLQSTAEAEFLRYRKITADARNLEVDPQDLYDMLELDRRTDRVLPNGWCLLPPRQVCAKGNACLTCDKFATDATFLPELQTQQARTGQLIKERRAAFQARTGQEMGDDNVWLAGRRQEHDALGRIILTLEPTRLADGTVQAVRGAGVDARIDAITEERDNN